MCAIPGFACDSRSGTSNGEHKCVASGDLIVEEEIPKQQNAPLKHFRKWCRSKPLPLSVFFLKKNTLAQLSRVRSISENALVVCFLQFSRGSPKPMSSFRRVVLVLAAAVAAGHLALSQDSSTSSSSSSNPAPTQEQQTQQVQQPSNQGAISVQARIKARREQRRAQAIHDVYSQLYEVNASMGYLRWTPGKTLQRVTLYAWDTGVTRYYNQKLGVTIDGRGYYGSPFVGIGDGKPGNSSVTNPAISLYNVMGGPTYRFITEPRYAVSGRVMAGLSHGNFSGDANGFDPTALGLYPDSNTFIISASAPLDYHVSPRVSVRLSPEYVATGYGSSIQNSFGFTGGFVFRFGKQ
jgi:hypothetical protein